jgi:hypothetical protein
MKYNDRSTIKIGSKYHEKRNVKEETWFGDMGSARQQKRRDASFLNQMLEFSYTLPDRIWWEALDKYEKPEAYETFLYKIRSLSFWSKDYDRNKREAIEYMMENHQPRVEVRRELVINKILS